MFTTNSEIPISSTFERQTYDLDTYFFAKRLGFDALLSFEVRDLINYFEKEIILYLKAAVIKDGQDEEPEIVRVNNCTFSYPATWWDSFKISVLSPYFYKLGLEKTWLSKFTKGRYKTYNYYEVTQINKNYWTLVVAPPNTRVYTREKLVQTLKAK